MIPLVSVLIPTFNRAHLLGDTIDSVIAQTYINWECIVVDDGSNDYTNELMEFYSQLDSRIKYHTRKELPKGASHCRNIALRRAKGDFVIFLDSDDLLLNECLKNRVRCIKEIPRQDFWVFPMLIEDSAQPYAAWPLPSQETALQEFVSNHIPWQTMCTLWDIKFLCSINGFNVNYPRLNDPEIHIRALLKSESRFKIFETHTPDCLYRVDAKKDMNEFAHNYYKSLLLFLPDICRELEKYNKSYYIFYLRGYLKDYLNKAYAFISYRENLKLIDVFYENRVFSFKEFVIIYYEFIFYLILKKLLKRSRQSINKILDAT